MGSSRHPAGEGSPATGRTGRARTRVYGIQASIAECHAVAPSVDETDWERIVVLYEALLRLAPFPIIQLNRAVAISMAEGPAAGLVVVDELVEAGSLSGSHLLHSVRGEILRRLGRIDEAAHEIELALKLCGNGREVGVLERKLAELR